MNDQLSQAIDVPAEVTQDKPQTQALTVRDAVSAVEAAAKPQITAAQAKIEAVANLTASCMAKASELRLTPEESAALQEPFADSDFQPGAAGKENLIYIQHSALRDRFNRVLGLGQWAIIQRSRWAEDYEYFDSASRTTKKASRVYAECMLLIRGCFVSEAIGDMTYYHANASTNYGDAVEGATTQAFRRCAKLFGVGLQAWDKAWCAGWWQRRQAGPKAGAPISHPRNAPSSTAYENVPPVKPPPPPTQPGGEELFHLCTVLTVKEVHSKPDAPKAWTAYFIRFSDGFGELEAATFDKKVAQLANELAGTNENASLTTKPGRKQGSKEIVRLIRAEQPPIPAGSTQEAMEFDADGNPIPQGVTP